MRPTGDEIDLIQRQAESGAVEDDPADLPSPAEMASLIFDTIVTESRGGSADRNAKPAADRAK